MVIHSKGQSCILIQGHQHHADPGDIDQPDDDPAADHPDSFPFPAIRIGHYKGQPETHHPIADTIVPDMYRFSIDDLKGIDIWYCRLMTQQG